MCVTKVVNLKYDDYDVYIGRGSKWGNPYTSITDRETLAKEIVSSKEEALLKYKYHILNTPELYNSLYELEGKILGCYCKPDKCHGDILLKLLSEIKFKEKIKNIRK